MKFKVGDKVTLKAESKWNNKAKHNPFGILGEVTKFVVSPITGDQRLFVVWSNKQDAPYDEYDLINLTTLEVLKNLGDDSLDSE